MNLHYQRHLLQLLTPKEHPLVRGPDIFWPTGWSHLCQQLYMYQECLVENLGLVKQGMCYPTQLCPLPTALPGSLIKGSHYRMEIERNLRGGVGRTPTVVGVGTPASSHWQCGSSVLHRVGGLQRAERGL